MLLKSLAARSIAGGRIIAAGGNPAALLPKSCAPNRRRQAQRDPRLVAQIRSLHRQHPNLGKAKLHVLLQAWCTQQGIKLPSVSTIGRIIEASLDRIRFCPCRIDRSGKARPVRCRNKPRKPKKVSAKPLEVLAVDTIERIRVV